MSDTDTRYYRIKIGDETHVFTNVFPMSNGNYSANAVWENGDTAKYYSTLSQSDINKAQIFDTFPGTEEFECKIKGYLVNAHEYDNGNYDTSGIWVDFPVMPEDKPKIFESIGLPPDAEQGKYFFDDFKTEIDCIKSLLNAYSEFEEIQDTALYLNFPFDSDMSMLRAVMETDAKFENLAELNEYLKNNRDYYIFLPATDETELGVYMIYTDDKFADLLQYEKDAIEPTHYGKYISEMEKGVFTTYGYIYRSGEEWKPSKLPDFVPKPLNCEKGERVLHPDTAKDFGKDLDAYFRENCEGYSDLAANVLDAQFFISFNILIGNTDYVRSFIHNMQKEHYLDENEVMPFLKRLDMFERAKGKTVLPEQEKKPSIRKQLEKNKEKTTDAPTKQSKNKSKDLEV